MTACIGLLMCFVYTFSLSYRYTESRIDEKLVRLEFTTVSDFTVAAKIPKRLYEVYSERVEDPHKGIPAFKEALIEEVRKILHAASDLGEDQTQVVDLQFVFQNRDMIKLLRKRARALAKSKMDKVYKYESRMDQLKEKSYNELRTPVKFFCTFENAYATKTLLDLKGIMFQGCALKFERPEDPTDVFWENHLSTANRAVRLILIYVCLFMVLGASGVVTSLTSCIVWSQYFTYRDATPGINCEAVRSQFSGQNLIDMAYVEMQYTKLSEFPDSSGYYVFLNERISRTGAY